MADSIYYDILGLKRTSTDSEVKNAYRKMALKWHPDKHEAKAKQLAEQKFRQIAEAYTILSDPKKRARFDQYGLEGLKHGTSGEAGQAVGWTFQRNPHEVFQNFFGHVSPFADLAGNSSSMFLDNNKASKAKPMPALEQNLYLSLEELSQGASKKVKIVRQAMADDMKSTRPTESILSIDVRPGWKAGTKLTFPGAGDEGLDALPGDVVLVIREKPHPRFERRKNDLIFTANISLLQGLVGTVVEVGTLDGRVLSVPVTDIVSPGYEKIVPGEGMPLSKDPSQRGNLIIQFNVTYPSMLSLKQKEQLELILPQ